MRTAPNTSLGSLKIVATPAHARGGGGCRPAHARAEQPEAMSAAATQSMTGDRRAKASTTITNATGKGTGLATSAPPAVDSASTMAAASLKVGVRSGGMGDRLTGPVSAHTVT